MKTDRYSLESFAASAAGRIPHRHHSLDFADIDLPWEVLVDDSGRPILDSSGRTITGLQPISAFWLLPDVYDPVSKRVLFQTGAVQ